MCFHDYHLALLNLLHGTEFCYSFEIMKPTSNNDLFDDSFIFIDVAVIKFIFIAISIGVYLLLL